MKLGATVTHECGLCLRELNAEEHRAARIDANLFGAVAYAICPCCKNPVNNPKDPEWRAAVDQFMSEQSA